MVLNRIPSRAEVFLNLIVGQIEQNRWRDHSSTLFFSGRFHPQDAIARKFPFCVAFDYPDSIQGRCLLEESLKSLGLKKRSLLNYVRAWRTCPTSPTFLPFAHTHPRTHIVIVILSLWVVYTVSLIWSCCCLFLFYTTFHIASLSIHTVFTQPSALYS